MPKNKKIKIGITLEEIEKIYKEKCEVAIEIIITHANIKISASTEKSNIKLSKIIETIK